MRLTLQVYRQCDKRVVLVVGTCRTGSIPNSAMLKIFKALPVLVSKPDTGIPPSIKVSTANFTLLCEALLNDTGLL